MEKKNYIILTRHMLFGIWFIMDEMNCTQDEMVKFMEGQNATQVKVIEGDFVKFKVTTEIDKESKEAIFKKHSQGRVFNEKENNQGSL